MKTAIIKSIRMVDNEPIHSFLVGDRVNFIEGGSNVHDDGQAYLLAISIDREKENLVPLEDLEGDFEVPCHSYATDGSKVDGTIIYKNFEFHSVK